ncbi:hypothetical protein H4219_002107 [Mycoemilia scoparia]|uniref:Ubiquitin-like domain-containing protein n=1 Tax=Mycoemilia scoparia TaxID=417184 RepID=A0A9W8A494_9FUNG|nr:hypothetical protein H4219_002107 [Mycoemilia scoparia]
MPPNTNTSTTSVGAARQKDTLCIRIKLQNGSILKVTIQDANCFVSDLKEQLHKLTEIPINRIRLATMNNTILRDSNTLESYNITDNTKLKMFRIFDTGRNSTTKRIETRKKSLASIDAANKKKGPFASLLENESFKKFMLDSGALKSMVMGNPQTKAMIKNNPEIAELLQSKEALLQAMSTINNPELMQEVQRNRDRAFMNLNAIPGGQNHLERFYKQFMENDHCDLGNDDNVKGKHEPRKYGSRVMSPTSPTEEPPRKKINTKPLPNPWSKPPESNKHRSKSRLFDFGGDDPFSRKDTSTPSSSSSPPRLGPYSSTFLQKPSPPDQPIDPLLAATRDFSRMQITPKREQRPPNYSSLFSFLDPGSVDGSIFGNSSNSNNPNNNINFSDETRNNRSYSKAPSSSSPESQTFHNHNNNGYNGLQNLSLNRSLPRPPPLNLELLYKNELETLEQMGFSDRKLNLEMLSRTQGDLAETVEKLDNERDNGKPSSQIE